MTLVPPKGERALPIMSGALLLLACPPAAFLLPPFIALAPLVVFIAERDPGPAGRWSATRAAGLAGLLYFGGQLYWLAIALVRYSRLAVPAYVLTVLVLAGLAGAFGGAFHLVRERLSVPIPLAAAVLWTALEWVQGHLGPLAFPWLGLGAGLTPFPRLAGVAELVGVRGLTFWLAAVNGVVAVGVLRYRAGRPVRTIVATGSLLVAAPAGFGLWRAATLELRPAARVAVVQPDIPEELKMDRTVAVDTSLAALTTLTREVDRPVDLVVWPEVALPVDLLHTRALLPVVERLSRVANAPILLGAYGVDETTDDVTAFNSAFVVEPGGVRGPRYDKQRLVPFVERVPFLDPGLLERVTGDLRYFGGLGRGRAAPVLATDTARFGVLICYESIFPSLARGYRAAGADFLVNITNDAWYGRDPWYVRTTALWQHPGHLVLRAIETRAGIARAANTGFSMFIDPLGRSYRRTSLFQPAVSVDTVRTTAVRTLFVRWGDWLGTSAAGAAVAMLLAGWWTGSRLRARPSRSDTPGGATFPA